MATITYKDISRTYTTINVYIDGKLAGAIKQDGTFYYYLPKGQGVVGKGDYFHSVRAVKASLEVSA